MDYSILIALLRAKPYLTDLEKDIVDTWDEWKKEPFDYNAKYPEIFIAIKALPMTVTRPLIRMTEADIQYNLENQLIALVSKRR